MPPDPPHVASVRCNPSQKLQPFTKKDLRLFTAVSRPEFNQNRFRNRDLLPFLFDDKPRDAAEQKRQPAAVSRQLALLRAHKLIRKVPRTRRYTLIEHGHLAIAALLAGATPTPWNLSSWPPKILPRQQGSRR
jgi:hypothetical protein